MPSRDAPREQAERGAHGEAERMDSAAMRRDPGGRRVGLAAIWRVLRGGGRGGTTDPRARLAALEVDLRERNAEVAQLRTEYQRLSSDRERVRAEARREGAQALAERLAQPLSQLATMQVLAESKRDVSVSDVLKLVARAESALLAAGATRVGAVGEQVAFDPQLHRPLADSEVVSGADVRVRFIGYRLGEAVLLKAQVSAAAPSAWRQDETGVGGREQ